FSREAYAYRPSEFNAVIDALLNDKTLKIDSSKLAVAGHSMGGWTAFTQALRDKRVKAIVLYSMGELNWLAGKRYFEADEIGKLAIPSIYFYGQKEARINRNGPYADFCFQHSRGPSYEIEIPGANHFVYNDTTIAPRSGGKPDQIKLIVEVTEEF